MSVTVVGSIAFDAVKTPFGERERMLGGAATHFALAASFFDTVRVVGPVGDDFTDEDIAVLATRGTDVSDAELRQLTERPNVLTAAREIIGWGPSVVVAKQGGYGAALVTSEDFFNIPA